MEKKSVAAKEEQKAKPVPTVSRVCADKTVIELTHDPELRKTALIVSRFGGLWNAEREVRIETGELLVPYSPSNNLISTGCVLLPSTVVPSDKTEILEEVEAFIHRYVDLSPLFERIAAHYVLLSWVHDAFNELPYLRLRGDYGTGKSRALMTIGSLCYKPFFASAASTVSPIFHTLELFQGTLILDEADLRFSDATAEIVKILNNGNVRGLPLLRSVRNRHQEFNPRAFRIYGPKIIAMRGAFADEALESRFLTEEMGVRPFREDIPISLPATFDAEARLIRNKLLYWRITELFSVRTDPSLVMPGIEPRLNQMALSLMSLIDDPDLKAEISSALIARNRSMREERSLTLEAGVLEALAQALDQEKGSTIALRDIAARFDERHPDALGQPATTKWIGSVLRRLQIATHKSKGIYVVARTEKPKIDLLVERHGVCGSGREDSV